MDKNPDSDWQTRCENTRQRLSQLWKTKLWADCKFLVGDESPEEVAAHKFVLAMSSPVFEAMFYGEMAEGSAPIAVTDVFPDAFRSLLEFLYTDEGVIKSYNEASALYYVAKKYIVPYVQQRCVSHMLCTLSTQNACFAYEFAHLFDENELLKAALKKIRRKTTKVLKETDYSDIQLSTLDTIFSEERLQIDCEMELFNAAEKYAKAHCLNTMKRNSLRLDERAKKPKLDENHIVAHDVTKDDDQDQSQTDDKSEELEKIRKVIAKIRFLTLSAQEFAPAALSPLLTEEQALAVMLQLAAGPAGAAPLPRGLSPRRDKRTPFIEPPLVPASPDSLFEAVCIFNVYNFKTRKRPVNSAAFRTDDMLWVVQMAPSEGSAGKSLGVFVKCLGRADSAGPWRCAAQVQLQLLSRHAPLQRTFTFTYTPEASAHGYASLVPWARACDAAAGLLRANTLRVRVKVTAAAV